MFEYTIIERELIKVTDGGRKVYSPNILTRMIGVDSEGHNPEADRKELVALFIEQLRFFDKTRKKKTGVI